MRRSSLLLALAVLVVLAGCAAPTAESVDDVGELLVEDEDGANDAGAVADGKSDDGRADDATFDERERDESTGDDDGRTDTDDDLEEEPVDLEEPADGLEVRSGEFPFDENRTFDRVQELLEVELRPPVVYVQEPLERPRRVDRDPSSFYAVMNVSLPDSDEAGDEFGVGGVASPMNAVYVLPGDDAEPAEIEQVLVHELVHAAQFQERVPQAFRDSVPAVHRGTTDAEFAYVSVMEGGAVYGSSTYTKAYDVEVESEGDRLERLYPNASPGMKLGWGPYYYGYRYVDESADSAADHWEVYDDPPVTMQGVMTTEPGSETELDPFRTRLAAGGAGWWIVETDTMGAFVLSKVLETELPRVESLDAASGWEYDRLARVDHLDADRDGYAWSIRFETESDTATFEAATIEYLESRATTVEVDGESADGDVLPASAANATWYADGYAYGVSSVDDRTVAILAGPDGFVESASVEPAGLSDVRVVVDADPEVGESSSATTDVADSWMDGLAAARRGVMP